MSKGEKLQDLKAFKPFVQMTGHFLHLQKKKNPPSDSHFHHESNNNKNGTSLPLLLSCKLEMYTTTFDPIKAKEKNCPIIICNIKK